MTPVQMTIIVAVTTCMGWCISRVTLWFLFSVPKKKHRVFFKPKTLLPILQERFAGDAAKAVSAHILPASFIEQQVSDPLLLEKLKPEIEKHVDHFLHEKLSTVFPLLYKFMGEKTLLQFKTAFLTEIDILFPVIMKKYAHELLNEASLEKILAEKITELSLQDIRKQLYRYAAPQIFAFQLTCAGIGFAAGLLILLLLKVTG